MAPMALQPASELQASMAFRKKQAINPKFLVSHAPTPSKHLPRTRKGWFQVQIIRAHQNRVFLNLWFPKLMVCLRVTFHENDGNHENDEDKSDSYKQGVECWINGNHGNHGNDENHGNAGCKPRVPQTTGLEIPDNRGRKMGITKNIVEKCRNLFWTLSADFGRFFALCKKVCLPCKA